MNYSLIVSLLLGLSAAEAEKKTPEEVLGEKIHKMHVDDPHEIDLEHLYQQEDFEKDEGNIPAEELNEADYLAPYKTKSHKFCKGSMVMIERVVTEVDWDNKAYIDAVKQDISLQKNGHSIWCVGKVFLKDALPWNGKFHGGAGYAAKICAVKYGRNGKYW